MAFRISSSSCVLCVGVTIYRDRIRMLHRNLYDFWLLKHTAMNHSITQIAFTDPKSLRSTDPI